MNPYFEVAQKHYPHLNTEQIKELLINATCFPFGSPEDVEENLKEALANTDGSLDAAIIYACDQIDQAMQEHREKSRLCD